MFTGIVQKIAKVGSFIQTSETSYSLKVLNPFLKDADPIALGESIACNGVCLTVAETETLLDEISFDLSPETVRATALQGLTVGRKINLERSLRIGDRMSGHWVQGHVDGTAKITKLNEVAKGFFDLELEFIQPSLLRYCVKKGSLTVDGISLTINDLGQKAVNFQIIPHTWAETALSDLTHGDLVNIEVDILAKYIERFQSYDQSNEPEITSSHSGVKTR